ncbi:hypothetical protein TDB9533_03527 [Thalassocella blandensis]|nr:hypothetical protein TDB9533_03527 [Thalassocella blandensis]
MKTTLDLWYEACNDWHTNEGVKNCSTHPIHSCLIEGQHHFIHAPHLPNTDPEYFFQLEHFAASHNINLKPDRRSQAENSHSCRRKKLLPIIFLTLGVAMESVYAKQAPQPQYHTGAEEIIINTQQEKILSLKNLTEDTAESRIIENILRDHYVSQAEDPATLVRDLKNLARYYSQHPEAAKLINALSMSDWELKYAPHTFQTDVSGTRLSVNKITIYFDPRSGAKLKFYNKCASKKPYCVASPADALLHEFLHVHSIINDINRFIADGGMGSHIYPAEHERQTILKENVLYKAMSQRDKQPRPIRSEHSGRHVLVSCVTCLK